jgi:hypothetical protein
MIVTFTGTRNGMTELQVYALYGLLPRLWELQRIEEFRHGRCVGADQQANDIVWRHNVKTIGYPVVGALCSDCYCDVLRPRRGHISRNREMVDGSQVVIAAPPTAEEQPRGGTWSTVRYARERGRLLFVLCPDGRVVQ